MTILYRIYGYCIALPLLIVVTLLVAVICSIFQGAGPVQAGRARRSALSPDGDRVYSRATRIWGKVSLWLFFLPVKTKGMENLDPKQSYVFIANHQGYLDILLCYACLGHSFKWMMKEYLKGMPIIGWACRNTHQIFVGDSRSSMQQAIIKSEQTLSEGMSMIIFPEGTRTYDGSLLEFRRGAFMLANEIRLPIVPLTINGSFDVFSRNARAVTWHPVELTVHRPITIGDRQGRPTKEIMSEVYDIINADLWKRE